MKSKYLKTKYSGKNVKLFFSDKGIKLFFSDKGIKLFKDKIVVDDNKIAIIMNNYFINITKTLNLKTLN